MRIIADLHIHSKYSRATSPQSNLEGLSQAAEVKGVDVLSVGDFTHPAWFAEIKSKLKEQEPGLFVLEGSKNKTRFILTSEISCIYKQGGKVRKVHLLVFAPNLLVVEKLNKKLSEIGNLKADGRPILGLSAKDLLKIALDISPDCLIVPCHAWTPWFAVFGSRSGFDSLEECFEEQTKHIFAIETGLSSDPQMNWRLAALDNISLISCSDAHSPSKIAREASVFDTTLSYGGIVSAIKTKNRKKFSYTIEFYPEEGKYHFDGHSDCQVCFSPQETKQHQGICPICKRPLIVGVLSRVEQLANRPVSFVPENAIPAQHLIPLEEIIAQALGLGVASKKVQVIYQKMTREIGNEIDILSEVALGKFADPAIREAIRRARAGEVKIEPGYDGVYGKVSIFSEQEKNDFILKQRNLFYTQGRLTF